MSMTISLDLDRVPYEVSMDQETGEFIIHNDELNTTSHGATESAAVVNFRRGLEDLVEFCLDAGLPIPTLLASRRVAVPA